MAADPTGSAHLGPGRGTVSSSWTPETPTSVPGTSPTTKPASIGISGSAEVRRPVAQTAHLMSWTAPLPPATGVLDGQPGNESGRLVRSSRPGSPMDPPASLPQFNSDIGIEPIGHGYFHIARDFDEPSSGHNRKLQPSSSQDGPWPEDRASSAWCADDARAPHPRAGSASCASRPAAHRCKAVTNGAQRTAFIAVIRGLAE